VKDVVEPLNQNKMKQISAVEWLFEQLDVVDSSISYEYFKQAKEMEKEQIIEAYETAMETDIYNEPLKIGKDYYEQTFKK
jgi:hypothetical protein